MTKPRRNDPCPCGSGRKYKKCCLAADRDVAVGRLKHERARREQQREERSALNDRYRLDGPAQSARVVWDDDFDELDDLSNSVLGLIRQERFDEALTVCRRLLDEYPEVIDGLERSAMVHAARGDHALAADFYRRCVAFIEQPDQRDHFDTEGLDYYRDQLAKMEQLATNT